MFLDDPEYRKLEQLLESMETIDDDCSSRDISFVKTSEQDAIEAYGISKLPALVFFKQDIPNLYEGNVEDLIFRSGAACTKQIRF